MVQCYVQKCKNRTDCQNWKQSRNVNKQRKITFHRLSITFNLTIN